MRYAVDFNGSTWEFNSNFLMFEQHLFTGKTGYLKNIYLYLYSLTPGTTFRLRIRDENGVILKETTVVITSTTGSYVGIDFVTPLKLSANSSYYVVIDSPSNESAIGLGNGTSQAWTVNSVNQSAGLGSSLAYYYNIETFAKTTFRNGQAPAVSAEQLNKLGEGIEMAFEQLEPIIGTYTGNGAASQNINLGFKPRFLITFISGHPQLGRTLANSNDIFGAIASSLIPSIGGPAGTALTITDTGFTVYYATVGTIVSTTSTNASGTVYGFIAFK